MTRLWIIPVALLGLFLTDSFWSSAISAPAPPMRRPKVEIVFVVDTTGSMSLVEPMKSSLYNLFNLIQSARPTPELRVGLVAFKDRDTPGNKEEYLLKPLDLRDNLDEVYAEFRTYTATGGGDTPEAVNEALDYALNKLSWSKERRAIRMMFLIGDAPAHMDYPDDVKYPDTCRRAVELGIAIHTIQAGSDKECETHYRDIARLSGGSYFRVDASGGFRKWNTDCDTKLRELAQQLFRSGLVYGSGTARVQGSNQAQLLLGLPVDVQAPRAALTSKSKRLFPLDFVDALNADRVRLADLKEEDLPQAVRLVAANERASYLQKVIDQRQKLIEAIAELDRKRVPQLLKLIEANSNALDAQIFLTFRKQAASQLKYTSD
ncbi:MAG: vWA domain-containing protein [Gemmataceae bacterium]